MLIQSGNSGISEDDILLDDDSTLESSIDMQDSSLIMDFVSNFYKNSIASIIRELTSNCFDAHTKANNIKDAVIIELERDYDNDTNYINFVDKGTGLSPELIKQIYLVWFKSDKRESNDFIGAFGLGSKSPFSYTDYFYINTCVDKVEYKYMFYKTKIKPNLPRKFLLDKFLETPTNKPNGTSIRIDIKEGDEIKFLIEIRNQLSYFNNVFIKVSDDFLSYTTTHSYLQDKQILKRFNDELIYEYKNFVFRNSIELFSDTYKSYFTKIHIVINTVKYDINTIEFPELDIDFPIGLKFEIGELDILRNREDIYYSDENKELIRKKLKLAKEELREIVKNQNNIRCDNLHEYFSSQNPSIKLGNSYQRYIHNLKNTNIFDNRDLYKTYIPFENLDIKINSDSFFDSVFRKFIDCNTFSFNGFFKHNYISKTQPFSLYNRKLFNNSAFLHYYITLPRYSKKKLKESLPFDLFDYYYKSRARKEYLEGNFDSFIRGTYHDFQDYEVLLSDGSKILRKKRLVPILGKAKILYTMYKEFKLYFNFVDEKHLTEEQISEYNNLMLERNRKEFRKVNAKILCYQYDFSKVGETFFKSGKWHDAEPFVKQEISVKDFEKYKAIIYKIKNKNKVINANSLVRGKQIKVEYIEKIIEKFYETVKDKSMFIYIEISQSELDRLFKLSDKTDNFVDIYDFLFSKYSMKLCYKTLLTKKFYEKYSFLLDLDLFQREKEVIKSISPFYKEILRSFAIESTKNRNKYNIDESVISIFTIKEFKERFHLKMVKDFKLLSVYLDEINNIINNNKVFSHISYNIPHSYFKNNIIKLRKIKHLKLNNTDEKRN